MNRESIKQRNETRIKKNTYNNFSPLKDEIEFSFFNNFGHEKYECGSKLQPIFQKDKTSTTSKVWKRKNLESESCDI